MDNREIEVRFLEIDKEQLINRLHRLGAEDLGEELLEEIIFYDIDRKWVQQRRLVRIRKTKRGVLLSYKNNFIQSADGAEEIELKVEDSVDKITAFLEAIGLVAYRHQQKKRHTFILNGVTVDIDDWPKVPTYVELEGESEQALKKAAKELSLDWKNVFLEDARYVIEKYGIDVINLRYFTFDKIE